MNIKQYYTNLSEKKFKFLTISLCGGTDLMIAGYIYHIFTDKERLKISIDLASKIVEQANPQFKGQIDDRMITELWQIMTMSVMTMIGLFLVIHFIVYCLHAFDFKIAKGYIKFYAWTTGVLSTLFAVFNLSSLFGIFLFPGILLITLGFGFGYREEAHKVPE